MSDRSLRRCVTDLLRAGVRGAGMMLEAVARLGRDRVLVLLRGMSSEYQGVIREASYVASVVSEENWFPGYVGADVCPRGHRLFDPHGPHGLATRFQVIYAEQVWRDVEAATVGADPSDMFFAVDLDRDGESLDLPVTISCGACSAEWPLPPGAEWDVEV